MFCWFYEIFCVKNYLNLVWCMSCGRVGEQLKLFGSYMFFEWMLNLCLKNCCLCENCCMSDLFVGIMVLDFIYMLFRGRKCFVVMVVLICFYILGWCFLIQVYCCVLDMLYWKLGCFLMSVVMDEVVCVILWIVLCIGYSQVELMCVWLMVEMWCVFVFVGVVRILVSWVFVLFVVFMMCCRLSMLSVLFIVCRMCMWCGDVVGSFVCSLNSILRLRDRLNILGLNIVRLRCCSWYSGFFEEVRMLFFCVGRKG